MATIQLKRSSVPAKTPTTSDLALGEIGINTYDGKMYIKKDDGTPSVVEVGAAELPLQTGNSGKYLTTNGSAASWATISGGSPGGSTGQLQYNDAGTFNGASNVTVAGGDLILTPSASPATATTTSTAIMRRSEIPYPALATNAIQNGNFTELYMQPHLGSHDIAWWKPLGNTTAVAAIGIAGMTTGGTATARTVATTNIATRARRIGYVGAPSVGATAGHYQAQRLWTTAAGTGAGGFYCVYRFFISDAVLVPQARMFVGMSAENGAFAAPQYYPANNYLGVGHDNGETSLKFIYNGSVTAPAWSSLGSSFPVALNTLYEVRIYSYTATVAHIELVNLSNGASAAMEITNTNWFPDSSTLLAPRAWRTNNSVSTAVALDMVSLYIEKPY